MQKYQSTSSQSVSETNVQFTYYMDKLFFSFYKIKHTHIFNPLIGPLKSNLLSDISCVFKDVL